jgi:hypothetical protein
MPEHYETSSMNISVDPAHDTITLTTYVDGIESLTQTLPRDQVEVLIDELLTAVMILEGKTPVVTTRPNSLRELVEYLTANPKVRITDLKGVTTFEKFVRSEDNGLWFQNKFLPINCRLTDAAAENEAAMMFDSAGFTLIKFDKPIRVEYMP